MLKRFVYLKNIIIFVVELRLRSYNLVKGFLLACQNLIQQHSFKSKYLKKSKYDSINNIVLKTSEAHVNSRSVGLVHNCTGLITCLCEMWWLILRGKFNPVCLWLTKPLSNYPRYKMTFVDLRGDRRRRGRIRVLSGLLQNSFTPKGSWLCIGSLI